MDDMQNWSTKLQQKQNKNSNKKLYDKHVKKDQIK